MQVRAELKSVNCTEPSVGRCFLNQNLSRPPSALALTTRNVFSAMRVIVRSALNPPLWVRIGVYTARPTFTFIWFTAIFWM